MSRCALSNTPRLSARGPAPSPRWCELGNTYVPQDTCSSAVRSVLKLNEQAIGIGEVEFRGPFFCTSTIFHSHADVVHQGSRRFLCTSSRLDAVAFERLDDLFRI